MQELMVSARASLRRLFVYFSSPPFHSFTRLQQELHPGQCASREHWVCEVGIHPGWDAGPSWSTTHACAHSFTPRGKSETPAPPTAAFLLGVREPENTEGTVHRGRTTGLFCTSPPSVRRNVLHVSAVGRS